MRILLLNHGYYGGGAERCVRELHQGLTARGHVVQVWVAQPNQDLPQGVQAICRPWEHKLLLLDLLADWTDWRHQGSIQALKQATAEHFDLLHIHSVGGGWMSLKALHKACDRLPAVWTHHDQWAVTNGFTCDLTGKVSKSVALEHTSGLNRLLRRSPYHDNWKNRRIGRLLDHWAPRQPIMVAPSQHLLQSIQACPRYAGSTALHLRNGVSLLAEPASHISQDQARQQWKIPPNRRVVLMLAAHLHDTHKGIRLGLEAIRQQPSGARPLLLLLGKNTDALSEQLNGLEVITGYAADQATLASAYRAADVTMIPSFADNFPFTALESLACQRPIVGFGMEGPGEIIGHNQRGLAAQPYEVDDLAKQLQTLLHDTALCEQLGRAGYQWVTSHCAMDHYLDQLEDIYRVAVQKFQNR